MGSTDLSAILDRVGSFGRFQKLMFLLICIPFGMNWALVYWSHYFIVITPPHQCVVPEVNDTDILNVLIPRDSKGVQDSCSRYDVDLTKVQQMDLTQTESYIAELRESGKLFTIPCDNGWSYDISNDIRTVVTEFNWVCENTWKKYMSQTVFSIGSLIGLFLFGFLSDIYGRYPFVVIANMVSPAANLGLLFCNNFYLYCALRFVMGMVEYTLFMMPFFILMEYLPAHARSMVSPAVFGICQCLVNSVQPWLYKYMGDWQQIVMYVSIVMYIGTLPALHFIPESASWLLTQGDVTKCLEIIKRIATFNGKMLPEKETEDIKSQMHTIKSNLEAFPRVTLRTALKCKTLCLQTLIGVVITMIVTLLTDANTRNSELVDASAYMLFTFYSVVMFPSLMAGGYMMTRWGRKPTLIFGFCMCCFVNLLLLFLPAELVSNNVRITLMVIFRAFDILSYTTATTFLTELLPTVVRARAMALINGAGSISMAIGPQVVYLGNFVPWLPSMLFSVIALLGVLLTSFLPETNDAPLVQTLEDTERRGFGKLCCQNNESEASLTEKPKLELMT